LLPRSPDNGRNSSVGVNLGVSCLGMDNLLPSDIFNEYLLGRRSKCDVQAVKPPDDDDDDNATTVAGASTGADKDNKRSKALQEWAYGMISNVSSSMTESTLSCFQFEHPVAAITHTLLLSATLENLLHSGFVKGSRRKRTQYRSLCGRYIRQRNAHQQDDTAAKRGKETIAFGRRNLFRQSADAAQKDSIQRRIARPPPALLLCLYQCLSTASSRISVSPRRCHWSAATFHVILSLFFRKTQIGSGCAIAQAAFPWCVQQQQSFRSVAPFVSTPCSQSFAGFFE
jgi:hypothetical protein